MFVDPFKNLRNFYDQMK